MIACSVSEAGKPPKRGMCNALEGWRTVPCGKPGESIRTVVTMVEIKLVILITYHGTATLCVPVDNARSHRGEAA